MRSSWSNFVKRRGSVIDLSLTLYHSNYVPVVNHHYAHHLIHYSYILHMRNVDDESCLRLSEAWSFTRVFFVALS